MSKPSDERKDIQYIYCFYRKTKTFNLYMVKILNALRDAEARAMKAEHKLICLVGWPAHCEHCHKGDADWQQAADKKLGGEND